MVHVEKVHMGLKMSASLNHWPEALFEPTVARFILINLVGYFVKFDKKLGLARYIAEHAGPNTGGKSGPTRDLRLVDIVNLLS